MNGAPSISHEIYVKKSAGWELHAAYGLNDRKSCLADAKELFKSRHFEAVRVVKETYDAEANTAHEEVLYRSPCRVGPTRPNPRMASPAKSGPRNVPAKPRATTAARPKADADGSPDSKPSEKITAAAALASLNGPFARKSPRLQVPGGAGADGV